MDSSRLAGASLREHLQAGQVIPAHPLALTAARTLDERRQRALTRYYVDAGAGGIAVGVHTTQFAVRDPRHGLYRPVLELAAETARASLASGPRPFALVAGAVGETRQAVAEAELAATLGYDIVLLGLGALRDADEAALIRHCRAVAEVLPLFGFYLQPAVGGRVLSYAFWREFAAIPRALAIKIAPFDRYRTLDVVRAVADAGRDDLALYTGNDDSIVVDLLTPFPVQRDGAPATRRIAGGLLGQYAVWTRTAVRQLERIRAARGAPLAADWLREAAALTDANAAVFDAAHAFAGCIPGIHEVLRRQGLLAGTWCLDPTEVLSPGQAEELDRVSRQYPELADDGFVEEHRDRWLS
ncbi:MAG: dihydrodipicolinate synthetase [Gemmatimonadetes bacterium]|jgi:dihydrodipicolinate synthase/N-acetylneuraminate lyase|nr:dihydrodipicolinate synthetase [Gemmatimonadota bacterium]